VRQKIVISLLFSFSSGSSAITFKHIAIAPHGNFRTVNLDDIVGLL